MIPLAVRLTGNFGERHITSEVADLSFRSEGNGGFTTAAFKLHRPIHRDAPELAALNQIYIYDARRPQTIAWQGYLEDPGRAADGNGEIWTINAVGPAARLKDVARQRNYVDRKFDVWRRSESNPITGPDTKAFTQTTLDQDGDNAVWRIKENNGAAVPVGDCGFIVYDLCQQAGQILARVGWSKQCGNNDTNWRFRVGVASTGYNTIIDQGWSTSVTNGSMVVTTDFGNTRDKPWFGLARNTPSVTITDETSFEIVYNIYVRGCLFKVDGTQDTAGASYPVSTVFAHEVVADILGKWMFGIFDTIHAKIDTTSFAIEQLAYWDPVVPFQILNDLADFEPNYRYAAWGDTQFGGNEFEYTAWDNGDILEYDPGDGWTSPESASDMYSDVVIRYKDLKNLPRTYTTSQVVPALQGLKRTAFVDLGSQGVTLTNVQQAAQAFLATHNIVTNTGTLTVTRPIFNATRGMMVDPWMIRPGTLLRLRGGVTARPDHLSSATRNGVNMFRVVSTEYSTATGATTLELDNYNPTLARQLATVRRKVDGFRNI